MMGEVICPACSQAPTGCPQHPLDSEIIGEQSSWQQGWTGPSPHYLMHWSVEDEVPYVIGPFFSDEQACEWGSKNLPKGTWNYVQGIRSPKHYEENNETQSAL